MKKPSHILIKLVDMGWLRGLLIDYRQTGDDSADTFVTITGDNGVAKGLWSTYEPFLDVKVGHASVCNVKRSEYEKVKQWRDFEEKNAAELSEYNRLRKKFE